jgi:hypothetical protein
VGGRSASPHLTGAKTTPPTASDATYALSFDRFRVQFAMYEIARRAKETASSQVPVAANAIAATANPMPAYRALVGEAFTPEA